MSSPWRNGGGVTREIARDTATTGVAGDDFGWRLSVAEVAESGSFSSFPGVDRVLVLLSGGGMDLDIDGASTVLRPPHGAVAFAGESIVTASLVDGPTTDLNVMCRRGEWRAVVEKVEEAGALGVPPECVGLVHVVEGELTLESGEVLGVGDTAQAEGPTRLRWLGGTAIVVALARSRDT